MRFAMSTTFVLSSMLVLAGCGGSAPSSGGSSYGEQAIAARNESDAEVRARKLILIGYQQRSKSQDKAGSERTLEWADTAAGEIGDATSRARIYTLLGDAHGRLGNQSDALKALGKARQAALDVDEPATRVAALAAVAAIYGGELKDASKAKEVFAEAEQAAGAIEQPENRALALKDLGKAYGKATETAAAEKTLGLAIDEARSLDDLKKRSDVLAQIGAAQVAISPDAANATFDEAVAAARQVDKLYSQVYALSDIAERMIEVDQLVVARKVLDEASAQVKNVPEVDLQAQSEARVLEVSRKLPRL